MDYIKDTIDYLVNFENLKRALENLKNKIIELEYELKAIKNIDYSGMPKGTTQQPDDRIVNLIYQIKKTKQQYTLTKRKVESMQKILNNLAQEDKKIIQAYYIDGLRGETLLKELHCSDREMYRIKKRALRTFAVNLYGINVLE